MSRQGKAVAECGGQSLVGKDEAQQSAWCMYLAGGESHDGLLSMRQLLLLLLDLPFKLAVELLQARHLQNGQIVAKNGFDSVRFAFACKACW